MEAVNPNVSRRLVLQEVDRRLRILDAAVLRNTWEEAARAAAGANALLELLENDDCGHTGGFDKGRGQPFPISLRSRYLWLRDLPQGVS